MVLAACTSGGGTPPTPTASAVPSSTPRSDPTIATSDPTTSTPTQTGPLTTGPNVRPGEKPPVFPELAKHHTRAGALAFASYYFDAYNWGYAVNDSALVQAISDWACAGCRKYVNSLKSLHDAGGFLEGGRVTVLSKSLSEGEFNYQSDYVVEATVNESRILIRRPNTSTMRLPPVRHFRQFLFVSWKAGRWKLIEVAGS